MLKNDQQFLYEKFMPRTGLLQEQIIYRKIIYRKIIDNQNMIRTNFLHSTTYTSLEQIIFRKHMLRTEKRMSRLNYAQDRKDHLSKPVTIGKQAKKG